MTSTSFDSSPGTHWVALSRVPGGLCVGLCARAEMARSIAGNLSLCLSRLAQADSSALSSSLALARNSSTRWESSAVMAPGGFLSRLVNHLVNNLLVDALANRCALFRFASLASVPWAGMMSRAAGHSSAWR